jgi:polyisoprenyl-teichoic acid--peptidoglycan teichoic acid transferase
MKAKKKKKKLNLIYKIIMSILFIATILFVIGLMYLNILSIKWFMIILGILLIIDLLIYLAITKSKKKKTGSFIAILLSLILSLGSFYVFKTNGLLNNMFSNYKTYNYSVIVLNDIGYTKLRELDNKVMGYLDNDSKEEKQSLEHIKNKITPDLKDYEDIEQMGNDLLAQNVDSILIEDSYLSMLKEENSKYETDCKVIYTFKVRVKIENFSKDVDVTKKTFSIYVSGIDTYGTVDSVSRSDVNMVVTVNPETKQILLTSIPRDYYVSLPGKTGYKDKLTHAGLYGVDMSVKTIEQLLDIEINYYVKVNFTSVIEIVDALGGVDVYSEYDFTSIDGYHYSKGYNKVNGEEALSFARERKAFAAGDNQRVKDQQALLQAMFQKCISKEIIYKYSKLLNSLNGSFVTNMPTNKLTSLIRMQLDDMAKWTITSNSLTGTDSSNYTYSYSSSKLYVMEPNEDSITEAHDLIESVYNGEILEDSYKENTGTSHTVTKTNPNKTTTGTSKKEETKTEQKEETEDTSKVITSTIEEDNSTTSTVTPPEDDDKEISKEEKDTKDEQEQTTSSTIEEDNKDKEQDENN